jgi:hypothetical protein
MSKVLPYNRQIGADNSLFKAELPDEHFPLHVMAGLVPAIHVLAVSQGREDVDARDERGHDGGQVDSIRTKPAL